MSRSTISTFKLFELFPDAETARVYLESRLWPNGVRCPECKSGERITSRKGDKAGYYICNACKVEFTVRTGTIFERSHVPLQTWLMALELINSDPEIPSEKLAQQLKVTQKTAWLILRRVHSAAGDFFVQNLSLNDPRYRVLSVWPAYRVGADGSVWTRWRKGRGGRLGFAWRLLNPTLDKDGYRVVRVYRAGWKQARVCRLICEAFHGPCPAGQECRHLDGDPANDAADNLTWGSSTENKKDSKRHGTAPLGETHHNAKLTDAQITAIRALKGKMLQREVAARFGTTQGYVSELWNAKSGKRITYSELTAVSRLRIEELIAEIQRLRGLVGCIATVACSEAFRKLSQQGYGDIEELCQKALGSGQETRLLGLMHDAVLERVCPQCQKANFDCECGEEES